MRLDKYLADCGLASRRDVKEILKKKRVMVNGQIETSPKTQVDAQKDQIVLDGQRLVHETFVYYLLNKPVGVLSATEDAKGATVLDLLDETAHLKAVFPVGRLDKDTEGLLLLTNNGPLAHALLSPKKHVTKTYLAQVAGVMDEADVERFSQGIRFKDFTSQPAQLDIIQQDEASNQSVVLVRLAEGKFHQVKRMVHACGKEVTSLKRLSMGPLQLDENLAPGEFRRLTEAEMHALESFGVAL
ncbi:pseudouridine synthase [Streptococcus sp. DD12]|uniref:pseudouridine synthase n=1 Tax=Streptococcus sp. DD12 TaxID=1777880 RepID=UPI00079898AC|nr:pseudouridine synthase [Streptococcus sp. DD12]KXT76611.1 Ribosomal small subunit pseudouridine synthase A [Streptococcus sp. DD12]